MTDPERSHLENLARRLRVVAAPVGPMSGLWDPIFDIEALLAGKRTIVEMTPAEWIEYATTLLDAVELP